MKAKLPSLPFNWQYLLWLGPLLITFGLSVGVVSGKWEPLPIVLIIAGAVVLGLALIYQLYKAQGFWGRRSTQSGTNALIATLAVLVILAVINFIGARYVGQIDLTDNQLLSLAPQSQEIISKLSQPLKLLVFTGTPSDSDKVLLEQYKRQSGGKFSYELIDPLSQPALAQRYNIGQPGNTSNMVLMVGERTQPLSPPLSESSLTPAIARMVNNQQMNVYFTIGHGERELMPGENGFAQAIAGLQNQNANARPLNLLTEGKIPADANVVVVAGPRKSFQPQEIKPLDTYLNEGGRALLLLDPLTQPGLDSLLKSWGVTLSPDRLVIDPQIEGAPAMPVITDYGQHPITRNFRQQFTFLNVAQPVTAKPIGNEQIVELLKTSDQAWAESNPQNPPVQLDPATDQKGPLSLGVAITRTLQTTPTPNPNPGQPPKEARLVVIGDSDFATDPAFNQSINGDLFLNSVSWLGGSQDQVLSIRPKDPKNRRLNIQVGTSRLISFLALGLLPFGAVFMAIFTWWRRR
jgi:ABC-type uncharacterized transport system involved in gliding motility auxiliary subunit